MSKITFSNGKSVNFNGTPTPEDIDYVAKQMGIQSTTPTDTTPAQPPNKGFLRGVGDFLGVTPFFQHEIGYGKQLVNDLNPSLTPQARQQKNTEAMKGMPTDEQTLGASVNLGTDLATIVDLAGGIKSLFAKAPEVAQKLPLLQRILQGGIEGTKIGATYGGVSGAGQSMVKNENAGQVLQSTASGIGSGAVTGAVVGAAVPAISAGVGKVGQLIKGSPEEELSKIQEIISPKATAKEARIAESEGRLVKGRPSSFWKSQTADEILPSDKTIKASETIQRNITDAGKMNETELFSAVDKKIGEIAKQLTPEMQKVPITDEVSSKLNDEWSSIKEKQISIADKTEEVNVAKRQDAFESNVLKKLEAKKNPTMNDLWEARQDYDNSVPERVKRANVNSDSKLSAQREEWLQNRKVLNNAINDSSTGLGKTSKQAFSDMSDMYNAKQGILSKAKIQVTALQPSTVKKIGKAAVKGVIGGTILEKAAKGLGASWLP